MKSAVLLTVGEVANRLKCHPQTVRRWIWSGKLGHVKAGGLVRIPAEEVWRLLKEDEGATGRDKRRTGVVALRATMETLRSRGTHGELAELTRKIQEGDQTAEWDSAVDSPPRVRP